MLKFKRTLSLFSILVVLVLNLSCTRDNVNGQSIANVGLVNSNAPKTEANFDKSHSKTRKPWQIGRFRGLVMGKSGIDDLQNVLGTPLEIADLTSVGIDEWAYHYQIPGDMKGKLIASVDKKRKILALIELRPDLMSREEVLKFYGDDFVVTRYSSDDCIRPTFDASDSYEDPKGDDWYIEYRDKGILIAIFDGVKDGRYDTVQHMLYLREPFGSTYSKCAALEKK